MINGKMRKGSMALVCLDALTKVHDKETFRPKYKLRYIQQIRDADGILEKLDTVLRYPENTFHLHIINAIKSAEQTSRNTKSATKVV